MNRFYHPYSKRIGILGVIVALTLILTCVLAGCTKDTPAVPFPIETTTTSSITDTLPSAPLLENQTIVCFGDSLFGMERGETSTPSYIAKRTGATVYNVGFGGCRMAVHPYTGYNEFSMYALADAITQKDWSKQDAAVGEGSSYFPQQLELLKTIDFQKVDIIVIHYGTNDFAGGVKIDSETDPQDPATLCGALRYSVEKITKAYPHLKVYISLPVYRYWTEENGSIIGAEDYPNRNQNTLPDFVEAIRKVAQEYGLPVIDGYNNLGINIDNASAFLSDGVHHSQAGRERFGNYIADQLLADASQEESE